MPPGGTAPSGVLIGGSFSTAGGLPARDVALWNGATLSPLGTWATGGSGYSSGVTCFLALQNGEMLAGGYDGPSGAERPCIKRWNGSAWIGEHWWSSQLQGCSVASLAQLPNGDLLAAVDSLSPHRVLVWMKTTN